MTTVRQIERQWNASDYRRMTREMLAARPEAGARLEAEMARRTPAMAMALIRMDELNLGYSPLYPKLLRSLLAEQNADGGWGDPLATCLAVRALLNGGGAGEAIERGMTWLADQQRDEGIWAREGNRRMPGDALVSAFVLYQLGDCPAFRTRVDLRSAVEWFEAHSISLEEDEQRLWSYAGKRCAMQGIQRQFKSNGSADQAARLRCMQVR